MHESQDPSTELEGVMTTLSPAAALDAFRNLVAEPDIPLDRACAWIAAEEQGKDVVDSVCRGLDELASRIRLPEEVSPIEAIARINRSLFDEGCFCGDSTDYYHPDNLLIDRVLERRRGLPILLSVIYIEVARRCGRHFHGIGFPGHFLISPAHTEPLFFLDPFRAGMVRREHELVTALERIAQREVTEQEIERALRPSTPREILIRINNNLRNSHRQQKNLTGMLRALERLLILRPDWPEGRRDRGLVLAQLGVRTQASDDLGYYLAMRPDAADAARVSVQLTLLLHRT